MRRPLSQSFSTLSVVLLTISCQLPHLVLAYTDKCPPGGDCGPFGICITDSTTCDTTTEMCDRRCSCEPGYFGDDCSFIADVCPEEVGPDSERECFNGGSCYKVEELIGDAWNTNYRCDCRNAVGQAAVYAGHRCEYPGEVSCEKGKTMSTYAFCVNGGMCKRMVENGESFDGCNCVGSFEGRHCQFAYGTAPEDELLYMPPTPPHTMSAFGLTMIIIIALGFVGGMLFIIYRRSKTMSNNREMDTATLSQSPRPPQLDADGELVLQDISGDSDESPVEGEDRVVV